MVVIIQTLIHRNRCNVVFIHCLAQRPKSKEYLLECRFIHEFLVETYGSARSALCVPQLKSTAGKNATSVVREMQNHITNISACHNVCWRIAQFSLLVVPYKSYRVPNVLWCRSESFDTSREITFSLLFEQPANRQGRTPSERTAKQQIDNCSD